MAECPLARCAQERRAFRKEFQRWSRDMLFVIGLERVAEEMMGSKRWNRMTQLENALEEQLQLVDWVPDQVCHFCDAQRLPEPPGPPSDYTSFKSLDLDEQSTGSDQASGSPEPPANNDEQPLDLSLHPRATNDEEERTLGRPARPEGGKRSYTEAELQAALRDIQSGKLGTRRAAVIYGIPRSTLRNKVYKLALERRNGAAAAASSSSSPPPDSLRQLLCTPAKQPLEHSPALGPLFAQFLSSIQQLALHQTSEEQAPKAPALPVVSDLIRLLAQERLADARRPAPADVILKVPSYRPAVPPSTPAAAASSSSSEAATGPPTEEKRTRPKRGRYRNYDRDHLIQAVLAVQRGEMSVHRAGTYFGVPHSTLEYKVKERHLLRPKKRRQPDGLLEALIKSTLDK
ncbi:mblk-1-related factor 1-like isoform X2 [Dermacentor variabilis]|uniref:mblk-1-related factor 1-like isoform X2 n=1 Tax=Dermacentor variabilis TaxID=34621 RepID=UPI003F5C6958